MKELGTLGGDVSSATAINQLGDIAGYSSTLANTNRAFLYSGGVMTDLGTVGGAESFSTDVNDPGQVVGFSNYHPADMSSHAFLYRLGAIQDLGTLGGKSSGANAINDAVWIVGSSLTSTSGHAFISDGSVMTDLNSLVDLTGTGLQYLSSAKDINEFGQITGEALNAKGFTVTYLLTPFSAVPESSTYGLGGVVILILVAAGRRLRLKRTPCAA